jgi:ATP-binding cassette, subfamily C, bacterial CydD
VRPLDPRLLRYASAARGYLAWTVGLGLAVTGLVLAQAGLLAQLLAGAIRGAGVSTFAGPLTALAVVLAARAAASYASEVAALRAAAKVKSQLRGQLSAKIIQLGPAWLAGRQPGEITALSTKGLDALDPYFARYLPQLALACLVPVAVLIRVALADWISALVIALTLPLIPVFAVLVGLHTRAQTQRQWRLLAILGGHFLDVVQGLTTLKVYGRAKAQAAVIGKVTDRHRRATMATLRVAFLSALVLELAATVATALVAVEVGLRLLNGHMDYRTALLVLVLTPEAYLPLRNAGAQFHASTEGAAAAQEAFEILDSSTEQPEAAPLAADAFDLRHDAVRLDGLSLRYPGRDQPALTDVSVTIWPGEQIAVTGPSGAGKTSLLALLLRFADPTSGHIDVGGTSLARIPAGEWRRQLAWVPQHPHLFSVSVARNIALGRPGASRSDIRLAAELAGADEFIGRLPAGYDTILGERGLQLSAGQRQRIALARAFLADAPLVLLDEPAAHLDPVSTRELQVALRMLASNRTVLQVTHDPAVIAAADRVLSFEAGRLVQPPAPLPARPVAAPGVSLAVTR